MGEDSEDDETNYRINFNAVMKEVATAVNLGILFYHMSSSDKLYQVTLALVILDSLLAFFYLFRFSFQLFYPPSKNGELKCCKVKLRPLWGIDILEDIFVDLPILAVGAVKSYFDRDINAIIAAIFAGIKIAKHVIQSVAKCCRGGSNSSATSAARPYINS